MVITDSRGWGGSGGGCLFLVGFFLNLYSMLTALGIHARLLNTFNGWHSRQALQQSVLYLKISYKKPHLY